MWWLSVVIYVAVCLVVLLWFCKNCARDSAQ